LDIDFSIREYSEHVLEGQEEVEGQNLKAASYVELVPTGRDVKDTRRSAESWWGVSTDTDIAGSGLRAVLSAVNSAIADRALPELKLSVGFNARSGQAEIADAIVNSLQLELPRRMQASFFEVVQRAARDSRGQISYGALIDLFRNTYGFGVEKPSRFYMQSFNMEHVVGGSGRQLNAAISFDGQVRHVVGKGNGPLSAVLAALHSQIDGTLSIREYSEHSLGQGTEVQAASYVELVYEMTGRPKESAWGVSTDTDITASGLQAVLRAASRLDVVEKIVVNGK
jgi:2-isopropylmalate synthase